jgi:glycosyltransferase involved in cell wall biosynthesis
MQDKLVSILIPLYNSGEWIEDTIQSVLNQTYPNIEIIIVDDGSSDNSFNVAKSYQTDKIKVIQQENKGACAARNKAFELSKGDYIVFFDADDLMSKDKIKNQMASVTQHGDDFVFSSQWVRFYDGLDDLNYSKTPIDKSFDTPTDWFKISWQDNLMGQTGIWLTPRNLIKKSGGWDESLTVNQDGEFFFRVLLNSRGIKFTEDAFTYYRSGLSNSISKGSSVINANSILKSYMKYELILTKENNSEIRRALAYNYIKFIYTYSPQHKELLKIAWVQVKKLEIKEKWSFGGKNFKFVSRLIGFKNALKIRYVFK